MVKIDENISLEKIGEEISQQKKIVLEIQNLISYSKSTKKSEEKNMISSQIESLEKLLNKNAKKILDNTEKIFITKPLAQPLPDTSSQPLQLDSPQKSVSSSQTIPKKLIQSGNLQTESKEREKKLKLGPLEKLTLKRMRKKEIKAVKVKERKASRYVKASSNLFYDYSMSLLKKGVFRELKRDLVKSNIKFVPAAYISVIFFTTLISAIIGFFISIFFLFFNLSAAPPFITVIGESILERLPKVIWILFFLPAVTFLFTHFYPSMERKSLGNRIDQELPFATIHMSSISSSMIEPSKIFNIITSTKEYPALEKEFIKIQNEINVYGYDLVTALRNRAFNSPSRKLTDLFNGLATTITSGGNLPEFFEKRSQSLLFEYRLEMEKQSKTSETFMDMYISIVIAAPMVLMLLLMMMRISGLGISLSPFMISLIMILSVAIINIIFLAFLHIKQPRR